MGATTELWRETLAKGSTGQQIAAARAAQGGTVALTGGRSDTSANAGGAVTATGGVPGATGVGGAVTLAGGAGGSTSGVGGAASITGGAGTAGNSAGGAASVTGGAGQGSAAGGAGSVAGGAAGATGVGGAASVVGAAGGATSGKGGAASVTAGAGTAGNASGGSVIVTAGAKHGSGLDGGVFLRAGQGVFRKYAAPGAGADQAEVLTAAGMINALFVHTISTGRTLTTPTGAQISAGCPTDLAVGDSFLFHLITVGTGADDIVTLTAGDGAVTFVGNVTAGPDASTFNGYGTWLFRNTGTGTWVGYRIG